MSVLSTEVQKQVEEKLVSEGLLKPADLKALKEKAEAEKKPFFSLLVDGSKLTNEQLTKTVAHVTKVPYVNLSGVQIDKEILSLLPKELAERYMAVPLGEMQRRLVVAMLDAGNVQAVDFLANKIGRPLKVYSASEEGIRGVIKQYEGTSLGKEMEAALGVQQEEQQAEAPKRRGRKPKEKAE